MTPTAPIHRLKRQARQQARQEDIPLHAALDRVAATQGFQSWSHLSAAHPGMSPADRLATTLQSGEMILLAARPGQGKTLLALELAARARTLGRTGHVFTLDDTEDEVRARLSGLGVEAAVIDALHIDTSDDISAGHVIAQLARRPGPALIVIDYLQLLDQRRTHPGLEDQIRLLRDHVTASGDICLILAQIHRSFGATGRDMPGPGDIRLPNPLDLTLFDRAGFLHEGRFVLGPPA